MPTFAPTGPQFTVHPPLSPNGATGRERTSEIASTGANGGFVVLWRFQDEAILETVQSVFRRFEGDGDPAGPVQHAGSGPFDPGPAELANFEDGSFITVRVGGGSSGNTLHLAKFNPNGQPAGTLTINASSDVPSAVNPDSVDLEPLADGGFVLSWETETGTGLNRAGRVNWQQYNAAGEAVTPLFSETLAANWLALEIRIEALEDGRFAVVHSEFANDGSGGPGRIFVKFYDSSWAPVSSTELLPRVPVSGETFAIGALENGQLVVVWATPSGIVGQLFTSAGPAGAQFAVSSDVAPSLDVAAHPDGGFVVTWTDPSDSVDTSGSSIKAQGFDAAGAKTGDEILVNDVTAGAQEDPDVAILANGDMVISWTTPEPGASAGVFDVAARIFRLGGAPAPINGTDGNDTLIGTAQDDIINGLAGNDIIVGGGGSDQIDGGEGNDWIDSGPDTGGIDRLAGGAGNDALVVGAGDTVVETVGGGFDNVAARTSYLLNAGAEVEVLSTFDHGGTANLALTGNEFGQSVIGNAGDNYLDGGGGADQLQGLAGNDTYIVDADDRVLEAVGGGFENVAAKTSFVLNAGAEIEVLSTTNHDGTANILLVGNEFGQTIIGNAGANYIAGGGGADLLQGLAGNDTYIVDADDRILEAVGGGFDNVAAKTSFVLSTGVEIEVLSTDNHSGTAAINLGGNEFGQNLIGNAGANWLDGGRGNDVLQGLGGADTFAFTTALTTLGAGNVDRILDMTSGLDRIALDDAVFTGLAPGVLVDAQFRIGSTAQDADDRIVYDPTTGALFFDADGNGAGAAIQFATLAAGTPLASADFVVI